MAQQGKGGGRALFAWGLPCAILEAHLFERFRDGAKR